MEGVEPRYLRSPIRYGSTNASLPGCHLGIREILKGVQVTDDLQFAAVGYKPN